MSRAVCNKMRNNGLKVNVANVRNRLETYSCQILETEECFRSKESQIATKGLHITEVEKDVLSATAKLVMGTRDEDDAITILSREKLARGMLEPRSKP